MRIALIFTFLLYSCDSATQAAPKSPQTQPAAVFSFPSAVRPGASIDVKFFDKTLGEPIGLWCNFAMNAAPVPAASKPGEARYKIATSADVPIGIYVARLLTSSGVSHPRLLMVDDLPTTIIRGENTTLALAREVSLPMAIDARCEPLAADYYRFIAKKGQHLSAEVVSQRLGSPMDPMIRLLDANGRELAYCDDAPGIGADCRFRYVFLADAEYFIEVRDVNYEGGHGHFYRLRLGDFPLITSVSPLGGTREIETKFHPQGDASGELGDVTRALPRDVSRAWVNARFAKGQGSGFAPVIGCDLEERVESKPNNTPKTANRVTVPLAITGQFTAPGEGAYFEFQAKAGQQLSIRGQTRSLNSRAALALQLLDADGKAIAESKPDAPDDGSLVVAIPLNGVYRVLAREIAGGYGAEMFYRLEIREVKPGFRLSVDTDAVNTAAGQSFKIKVVASRHDYTGPIALSLAGDASGYEFKPAAIAAGKSDVELEIKVPAGPVATRPLIFGIIGKGRIGKVDVVERASTKSALSALFPRLPAPPPEVDGLIGLGVK